jgi:osmotically-inducible protein OsmY
MNILRNLCLGLLLVSGGVFAANVADPASATAPEKPLRPKTKTPNVDSHLRRTIYRALKHDGGVATAAMTIRVRNGLVTLEGTVPDASQVSRATSITQSVSGVTSIENRLRVEVEEN